MRSTDTGTSNVRPTASVIVLVSDFVPLSAVSLLSEPQAHRVKTIIIANSRDNNFFMFFFLSVGRHVIFILSAEFLLILV